MKLTKRQIELANEESIMYRVFDPNYICNFSKKIWNEYKIGVKIYYKDGDFWKAEKSYF